MPYADTITDYRHTVPVTFNQFLPPEDGIVNVTYYPTRWKHGPQQQRITTLARAAVQMGERAAALTDLDERNRFYDDQNRLMEEEASGVCEAVMAAWDITERDGSPVPISRASFLRFGVDTALKIFLAIWEDMNGGNSRAAGQTAALPAASTSSSPSGTSVNGTAIEAEASLSG